jgi:tellurite resistance protein TerC
MASKAGMAETGAGRRFELRSAMTHFPFAEYWWFYLAFSAFVVLLLGLDLGVFHRTARPVSFREATAWSAVWICIALAFEFFFYRYALWVFGHDSRLTGIPGFDPEAAAQQVGLQFLSGYLVEKALSLDNIFVFVVVFSFFGIPAIYHRRVLFYGILGALVFRGIFIAAGSALLRFHWVMVVFGALLILTGIKMMFVPDRAIEPERNPVIRLFRRFVPVTPTLCEHRFFVRRNNILYATPLLPVLLFIEVSDIVFAIDSVPANFRVDARAADCVHVQYSRDPWSSRPLLSAGRGRRTFSLAEVRFSHRAGVRRPEDGLVE